MKESTNEYPQCTKCGETCFDQRVKSGEVIYITCQSCKTEHVFFPFPRKDSTIKYDLIIDEPGPVNWRDVITT